MRFNRSIRRPQHVIVVDSDGSAGNQFHWTLVPHSINNQVFGYQLIIGYLVINY